MRLTLAAFLLVIPLGFSAADVMTVVAEADVLDDQGSYAGAVQLLLGSTSTASAADQAELYWRAARETLAVGDLAEKAGKPQADVLAAFVEGEGYADKAIAADPKNDLGYFWKSANIGRWGQVKGVMNALMKAQPMKDLLVKELSLNPDRMDAYFVLGQLYRELPGWPVSFGNTDAAVSLGRRAVDGRPAQVESGLERALVYNFSTELAKTLYKRNWSAATRTSEQKNKAAKLASAATPLDKGSLYEATIRLKDVSDREEARVLVLGVVDELEKLPTLTDAEKKDLAKAKDILKGW